MYSSVAVSLIVVSPFALSLWTAVSGRRRKRQVRRTHSQGSIKCMPSVPRLSNVAYIGNSQKPGSTGCPLRAVYLKAVICHPVVERVGQERVCARVCHGDL